MKKAEIIKLVLATMSPFLAAWAIYLVYNPPIPQNVFSEIVNATSTIPLVDILSRVDDFKTAYERQNFLKTYTGKYVSGRGTYSDFFGDDHYYVIIDIKVGWWTLWRYPYHIACSLKDSSEDAKDILTLLRQGETLYFVGTFSNSNLNGYYYPTIDDCSLLEIPTH